LKRNTIPNRIIRGFFSHTSKLVERLEKRIISRGGENNSLRFKAYAGENTERREAPTKRRDFSAEKRIILKDEGNV
jgi:hypothetical protein